MWMDPCYMGLYAQIRNYWWRFGLIWGSEQTKVLAFALRISKMIWNKYHIHLGMLYPPCWPCWSGQVPLLVVGEVLHHWITWYVNQGQGKWSQFAEMCTCDIERIIRGLSDSESDVQLKTLSNLIDKEVYSFILQRHMTSKYIQVFSKFFLITMLWIEQKREFISGSSEGNIEMAVIVE